jgi:hypothetical protein
MKIKSVSSKIKKKKVTMTDKSCIIEFQAFRGNNKRYIIKELVILDLQTYVIYPFMFKPPVSFNKLNLKAKITNRWIAKNFHHIEWNEGFTSYKDLENIMFHFCQEFTKVYTKGLEKSNWIKLFTTGEVIEVKVDKSFDCGINNVCILSKNKQHRHLQCAVKNAYRLAAFLQSTIRNTGVPKINTNDDDGGRSGGESEAYKYEGSVETYH